MYVRAKSIQLCLILHNPITVECQAPLSMVFSRQEYWSGLPRHPPGDLPHDPGIEPLSPVSLALAGRFFTTSTIWEVTIIAMLNRNCMKCHEVIFMRFREGFLRK